MQFNNRKTSISAYYSVRFEGFLTDLSQARDLSDASIHKIRVDIKKLRALLLVLEELGVEERAVYKLEKQFRPVFRASGKLRTIQLGDQLLKEFPVDTPLQLLHLLEKDKSERVVKLNKTFDDFNFLKFEKRVNCICIKLEQLELDEFVSKLLEFIQNQMEVIDKVWNTSKDVENLHQLRKYFKVVKTLYQFLIKIHENDELQNSLNLVNEIESKLGLWHDYEVFDQRMLVFKDQLVDSEHRKFFRELRFWKREEKLLLLKEIKALMKDILLK